MKTKRDSNLVFTIKVAILLLIIFISAWKFFTEYKQYSDSKKLYEEVAENVVKSNSINSKEVPLTEDENTPVEGISSKEKIEIDFEYLKNANPDVVAWIRRDDEKINYPVVKGKDNDFYLYRSLDKSKNKCGSIFMDYKNDGEFTDDITYIYGHNMKDGSMFASLKDYEDSENVESLPDLYIYTPNGSKKIEIKYVFFHSGYDGLRTNFEDDSKWGKYFESLDSSANYVAKERPERGDRLIGLVTCEYVFENARLVVLGKLVD